MSVTDIRLAPRRLILVSCSVIPLLVLAVAAPERSGAQIGSQSGYQEWAPEGNGQDGTSGAQDGTSGAGSGPGGGSADLAPVTSGAGGPTVASGGTAQVTGGERSGVG